MKRLISAKLICFPAVFVLFLFLIGACASETEELKAEQIEELARSYFLERYQKNVRVCKIDHLQIMEHLFLKRIIVYCEGTEYELVLDQNNCSLSDSVSCCRVVETLRDEGFLYSLQNDIFADVKKTEFHVVFSSKEMRYVVTLSVDVQAPVAQEKEAEVYTFLTKLKERNVYALVIGVVTPDFLLPVEGGAGVELAGAYFYTDMKKDEFQEQFLYLSQCVHWNESLFQKKLMELENIGVVSI